jgi:Ca-activated chloride channel family protein
MSLWRPWRFVFLGYPVALSHPVYLVLCLAAVALALWGLLSAFRREDRVKQVIPERLLDRLVPGISMALPAMKSLLYGGALALMAMALAQPQCGSRAELVKRRGIDLVVALDVSKSMLARDVQPNRLERAKLELMTLLDELKGDRVGLVIFAGDAFIQCPLTSDYAAAKMFLRAVDPEQMQEGGTNIGSALVLAKQVLDGADRGAKDRVVILISDGEDLEGEIGQATDALSEAGIRVFAVGIGSESGEPIPVVNKRGDVVGYKKNANGETVLTRLNRAGLASIARATDGELFYQPQGVAMSEVVSRIDRLQKSVFESRLSVQYDERFQYLVAPAFGLLLAGMLLRASRRRAG